MWTRVPCCCLFLRQCLLTCAILPEASPWWLECSLGCDGNWEGHIPTPVVPALMMVGTFSDFLRFPNIFVCCLSMQCLSLFFASLERSHALHNNFSELNSLIELAQ